MNEFLVNLSSLSWWLGVVVVGILINIVSPYLNRWLERTLLKTSSTFRRRAIQLSEQRNKRIAELKADPHKQILFAFREQRLRIRALYGTVGGISVMFMGFLLSALGVLILVVDRSLAQVSLIVEIISILFILFGMFRIIVSMNDNRKVLGLRNILNEVNPDMADADIFDWL